MKYVLYGTTVQVLVQVHVCCTCTVPGTCICSVHTADRLHNQPHILHLVIHKYSSAVMGRKQQKQIDSATSSAHNTCSSSGQQIDSDGLLWVDPNRIRFQHSKIRPYFSSCGRSIEETLREIRTGLIKATDLPPILVLVGSDDWYFSLNNRRLYVLKICRDEGLLEGTNNTIPVRIRQPKSASERARYTVENCSLHAKLMKESLPTTAKATTNRNSSRKDKSEPMKGKFSTEMKSSTNTINCEMVMDSSSDTCSDNDDTESPVSCNRFASLSV